MSAHQMGIVIDEALDGALTEKQAELSALTGLKVSRSAVVGALLRQALGISRSDEAEAPAPKKRTPKKKSGAKAKAKKKAKTTEAAKTEEAVAE